MYTVIRAKKFEKAIEKMERYGINKKVFDDINFVVKELAFGRALESNYRDHKLNGEWEGYRDCHIRGDLILIYKIEKDILILSLINLGTHNQLGI